MDPEVVFIVNSSKVTDKIAEISRQYGVDFNSVILLLVVGQLAAPEISDYLMQEKGLSADDAALAANELIDEIILPLERRLLLLSSNPNKQGITLNDEKRQIKDIFSNEMLRELNENALLKNALNLRILNILSSDINFRNELRNALHQNKESITRSPIMMGADKVNPTISNWLRDFWQKKGSHDMLAISDYLVNDNNTQKLSNEERTILFDLFLVYRNIDGFPEVFAGIPPEQWEIIPIEENKKTGKSVSNQTKDFASKFPLTKEQMRSMSPIEKMVAMQEYGLDEAEWERLAS